MTEKLYVVPAFKKVREANTPLARIAEPEDTANVIELRVSRRAGYVTGRDVCVDGGSARSILSHIPGRPSLS